MNFVTYKQFSADVTAWAQRLHGFDLIVGITRSGMLPASIIALHHNIALSDSKSFLNGQIHNTGLRGRNIAVKNVLVVDDSICSGKSINDIRRSLTEQSKKYNIKYAAVYAVKESIKLVDYYYKIVELPRCWEWNVMHYAAVLYESCLDIDGVLCVDPTPNENDDGENYINFLKNTKPLCIPSVKVGNLVTSRLEKYRSLTEQWLHKHNVKYGKLIMTNLPDMKTRQRLNQHAEFKANQYKLTGTKLFIESDDGQAQKIYQITKKPVLCYSNMKMYK